MSGLTWQSLLRKSLSALRAEPGRAPRIVLLGVGNELNGDDAAGVRIIQRLKKKLVGRPDLLLVEAGVGPENFTGSIIRFHPDLVIWIDAADMGVDRGQVSWIDVHSVVGMSAFTHTLTPAVLLEYLQAETGCRTAIIGIQPERLGFDQAISPRVQSAVRRVSDSLLRIFRSS